MYLSAYVAECIEAALFQCDVAKARHRFDDASSACIINDTYLHGAHLLITLLLITICAALVYCVFACPVVQTLAVACCKTGLNN